MHPYWIQKIEESRKNAVITFWVVAFLIVILPLMLVMHSKTHLIVAIICFVLAGLRVYSTAEGEGDRQMKLLEAKKALQNDPMGAQPVMPGFATAAQTSAVHEFESGSKMNESVIDSFPTSPESFFTSSLEPGQALNMEPATQPGHGAPSEALPQEEVVQQAQPVQSKVHFHDLAGR